MTLIFGDHGMTEDGNHGGGTEEEIRAALFVHRSAACPPAHEMEALETSSQTLVGQNGFSSIHQIDLVPSISMMLGLPIPFANLGSLTPSILAGWSLDQVVAGLALNAAQVWRYLSIYSSTANLLPGLGKLRDELDLAVSMYKEALAKGDSSIDADQYHQAAVLFRHFLFEALELGQRVWARFDGTGMILGILVGLSGAAVLVSELGVRQAIIYARREPMESIVLFLFVLFVYGLTTFSNSYILEEQHTLMYAMGVLAVYWAVCRPSSSGAWLVPIVAVCARLNEYFVSGHGLDPSIRLHAAHHTGVFLASLALFAVLRSWLYRQEYSRSISQVAVDVCSIFFLAVSWVEKRSIDHDRNGYWSARIAFAIMVLGFLGLLVQVLSTRSSPDSPSTARCVDLCTKLLIATMAVTGPASVVSAILFSVQMASLYRLTCHSISPAMLAILLKLASRHVFFATNHGCAFSRLQYSAAFIATKEFYFTLGGISLFLNTFAWEILGVLIAWYLHRRPGYSSVLQVYCSYQLLEMITSCLSVGLLRRHLMVWDIFAPHFLFVGIFTVLTGSLDASLTWSRGRTVSKKVKA